MTCAVARLHAQLMQIKFCVHVHSPTWKKVGPFDKTVAHAVAHAEVLGLCLREQLVTHTAHFKFQSQEKHVISRL